MTKNQIEYQKLLELKRSNRAGEEETHRSNVAQEELTRSRDTISLDLRGRELGETQRANLAREAENYRSNVAREAENTRSNLAREAETQRHNYASEKADTARINLGYSQLAETRRSNKAQEALTETRQDRQYYIDLANQQINNARNAETKRANQEAERLKSEAQAETKRHNEVMEGYSDIEAGSDMVKTFGNLILRYQGMSPYSSQIPGQIMLGGY